MNTLTVLDLKLILETFRAVYGPGYSNLEHVASVQKKISDMLGDQSNKTTNGDLFSTTTKRRC